jgi:hypothetical protein
MTKNSVFSTTLLLAACAFTPLLLTGCGGGSDTTTNQATPSQTQTLNGVAATGKPFAGKVVVVNAQGDVSAPVDIAVDGSFSVTLPAGAPYLIKAYSSANANATLYSYAASASVDGQININQLTTAAVLNATANVNLDTLFSNWKNRPAIVNDDAMLKAATQVVFNLNSEMIRLGLTTDQINTLNVFTVSFSPITGDLFDLLLDNVSVDVSCGVLVCNAAYKILGQTLVWQSVVDPSQFHLSFALNTNLNLPVIVLGDYTRTMTTSIAGRQNTVSVVNHVGKPLLPFGFCRDSYLKNNLEITGTVTQCVLMGKVGTVSGMTSTGLAYSTQVVYSPTFGLTL